MAEIDLAVDLKRRMLQLERKKEKELEKRVYKLFRFHIPNVNLIKFYLLTS